MSTDPNMPDIDLSLEEAALGTLSSDALRALEERLAADPAAQSQLDGLREIVASLALAAAPAPPAPAASDPIRARLLARATADVAARPAVASTPSLALHTTSATREHAPASRPAAPFVSSTRTHTSWYVAGAAGLLAAASLLLVLRANTERSALRDSVRELAAERSTQQLQLDSLVTLLSERDQQLASVTGPDVAVVELASTSSLPPSGRMFWDRATARWTFVANNLPALRPGRAYALWLISGDQRIGAGTFTPDANGVAVVRATYDLPRNALAAVAVTEEPEGGVPQPTGEILLVGSAVVGSTR